MGRKSHERIHRLSATHTLRVVASSIFTLLLLTSNLSAQDTYKYWIQFTDKENNGYSVNSPEAFLSSRAIERRERQNIPIQQNDLPLTSDYIAGVRSLGFDIHNRSKWFNAITIEIPKSDSNKINEVISLPYVKGTQPVAQFKIDTSFEMKLEVPRELNRRSLDYEYGLAYLQINMLGGSVLHDLGYRGEGMLIAVMDGGFIGVDALGAFENLRNDGRIVAERDFVGSTGNVFQYSAHGMYVLSTMAAEVPGLMVGTAPRAMYALLVTEDVASELLVEEDNWVAGAEFADSIGADVCNTSLSYTRFDVESMNHTYSDMDGNTTRISRGADIAASKGMIIVNSAGNSGNNSWRYIGAPADGDSVLAVGAVNRDSIPAPFTSFGPSSDGDVKPNVAATGWGIYLWSFSDSIRKGNGTSFSSPIIAGMSACLWQAFPQKNNMDIFYAIQQSASQYENPDDRIGYGIPNYAEAMFILSGGEQPELKDTIVTVSPNPTYGFFSIGFQYQDERLVIIELINIQGQRMYEDIILAQTGTTYGLPVNVLKTKPNGVYLLRVQTEDLSGNVLSSSALRIIKADR